jgi:hypothetical protein
MEQNISVKRILPDILSIKEQVIAAFKGNVKYETLLAFLFKEDYYNDEDLAIPTLKQIEKHTGLRTSQLRTQLKNIYKELFHHTFDFKKIEIFFDVEYFKRYGYFKCNELTNLPKIGENITIPFLKSKVGTDYFYVEDIRHYFDGQKQTIDIQLKGGYFNSYWYYRKHKAYELGELGRGQNMTCTNIK